MICVLASLLFVFVVWRRWPFSRGFPGTQRTSLPGEIVPVSRSFMGLVLFIWVEHVGFLRPSKRGGMRGEGEAAQKRRHQAGKSQNGAPASVKGLGHSFLLFSYLWLAVSISPVFFFLIFGFRRQRVLIFV